MKTIRLHLKALLSFGAMALVVLMMAAVLVFTAINHTAPAFGMAQERMNLINALEGRMGQDLNQMQVQHTKALAALQTGRPAEPPVEKAAQSGANILQLLRELEARGVFSPRPNQPIRDTHRELDAFKNALTSYQGSFDAALGSYRGGPNPEWREKLKTLETQRAALNESFRALIIAAEQDRLAALQQLPGQVNRGILITTLGMMACLLLALIGYRIISKTVRPFRHVRNMITAIGGDQYRASMYQDLLGQRSRAGSLAQALDTLARGEQERNAEAKQKIEQLRRELLESRRQRLKLYREPEKVE